ncbi:MAG TPA: hypothetical protein VKT18_04425, partial [Acidimicrobiales bacterium]|nr:hypothetical protein [Acidimicrobiales bacterium]
LDRHAGRLAALYLALIAAFCVVIIVGLSSSLGGNVSYFQVGHHYFESGGDCYTCPSTAISKSTYLSAARGSGIADSWGYLVGAVVCVLVGTTLHRASRTASVPGRVAHPEPPLR